MQLASLVKALRTEKVWGDLEFDIQRVQYDSRKVEAGDCFFALPGENVDGNRFVAKAIEAGASAIVSERAPMGEPKVPWIEVENPRQALGLMANELSGRPSANLAIVGVTGTNGKTTTAFLTRHLFEAAQRRCGLLGTVEYDTGARVIPAARTTPESADVHELFSEMVENGCRAAVMEVSSHGLEQHRVEGVEFNVGVFTNLSQDHLDYHGSMPEYFKAKKKLFLQLQGVDKAAMVVNGDDTWGQTLLRADIDGVEAVSYGCGVSCDFRATNIKVTFDGTTFALIAKGREILVRLPYIGLFNVYNALAALAATNAAGLNLREAIQNLANGPQVPGRLESVAIDRPYHVFVDYAHTPDALEKAASTLRDLDPRRLITVFGCGGDRDREKRAPMAKAASEFSDAVILTSDNPRNEDPKQILADAEKGILGASHTVIEDRAEAINAAIDMARPRDVILIAGKGHETYQQFADKTIDFDDRQVARNAIARARDERIKEREERERERELEQR
ncbi:MAG: UDP-N-acetylmuramoyl-L-alanyl-D-glutamate--2,6-diaminopimelate ligase [Verrucomicrobiota bacterium]